MAVAMVGGGVVADGSSIQELEREAGGWSVIGKRGR
jgi:hypothetical protein